MESENNGNAKSDKFKERKSIRIPSILSGMISQRTLFDLLENNKEISVESLETSLQAFAFDYQSNVISINFSCNVVMLFIFIIRDLGCYNSIKLCQMMDDVQNKKTEMAKNSDVKLKE